MASASLTGPRDRLRAGRRRIASIGLASPAVGFVLLFGLIPLGTLFLYSFYTDGFYVIEHDLTVSNYTSLFDSEAGSVFFSSLWRTLLIACAVTSAALALAFPTAYFCVRRLRRSRFLVLLLLVVPLFTSYLVKVYGWRGVLGERGIFNYALTEIGLVGEPLGFLLFNRIAVAIALLGAVLPFVILPIYTALERVPKNLLDAASDLGAGGAYTFRNVLLPLTRRGILTGCILSFIICLGDFIASQLLGGASGVLVGKVVYSFFGLADDWPSGTARAFVLLFVVGMSLWGFAWLARAGRGADDVVLDSQVAR